MSEHPTSRGLVWTKPTMTMDTAHACSGASTLSALIDNTSYSTFLRSTNVLHDVLHRALQNNRNGKCTVFDRSTAQYRDLVLKVPGLEAVLFSAGFVMSDDDRLFTLETTANSRILCNRIAELNASDTIRQHRMRTTQLDEMMEGIQRRTEQSHPWEELQQKQGSTLDFDCDDKEKLHVCINTLEVILRNILKAPDKPRYRRIRIENERMHAEVFSVRGGREYLSSAGFVESSQKTYLVLPEHACLWKVRAALEGLEHLGVTMMYKAYAKEAENDKLVRHLMTQELLYEMLDTDVPVALGHESFRNYRVHQLLDAPVKQPDGSACGSPTLAEVQHVLGIDSTKQLSVLDRMELRRKKSQLVRTYESALQG